MKKKAFLIGGILTAVVLLGGWALAQSRPHGPGGTMPTFMHAIGPGGIGPGAMRAAGPIGMGRGMMGMVPRMMGMGPSMMGGARDSANMAQLQDIHALLINHDRIKRTITNLPDGIRTVTVSDDPQVAALLKKHVAQMSGRVKTGDDPGLPIESPALHAIFRNKDKIKTIYETTKKGVIVVQTSTDPETVAALQKHAAEVTDLARGGMAALHTAMLKNNGGMMGMRGMMFGPMMHGMAGSRPVPNAAAH